jgi:hypothetical protein
MISNSNTETANSNRLDRVEQLLEQLVLLELNKQSSNPVVAAPKESTYVNADEAAGLLGFNVTKSRTHTRRLAWYRRHGFLKTFFGTSRYSYLRVEVMALAERIKSGEVPVPPVL